MYNRRQAIISSISSVLASSAIEGRIARAAGISSFPCRPVSVGADEEALSISAFQISNQDASDFNTWLRGAYLPAILRRPGHVWAAQYKSVPGSELLLGPGAAGEIVHTENLFLAIYATRSPSHLLSELSEPSERLADSSFSVTNDFNADVSASIFSELSSVGLTGGSITNTLSASSAPPFLQLNTYSLAHDDWEAAAWLAGVQAPLVKTSNGLVGMRQLGCLSGNATLGVMYEFWSRDAQRDFAQEVWRRDRRLTGGNMKARIAVSRYNVERIWFSKAN